MSAYWMNGVRNEAKIIMYDDGKYLVRKYETALYSKMLFEEIFRIMINVFMRMINSILRSIKPL